MSNSQHADEDSDSDDLSLADRLAAINHRREELAKAEQAEREASQIARQVSQDAEAEVSEDAEAEVSEDADSDDDERLAPAKLAGEAGASVVEETVVEAMAVGLSEAAGHSACELRADM